MQYKTIENLRDSDMLYNQNPPAFSHFLVGSVMLLIIVISIWSVFAKRTYIVSSGGSIVSEARNYIMSSYSGKIVEAVAKEGDYVKKGEVLFQIISTDLDLQAEQISGMILADQEKIVQYQRLESSIKTAINQFDENIPADKPFFYQYETYLDQIQQKDIDPTSLGNYNYTEEQIERYIRQNEAAIAEIYHSTLKSIADSMQSLQNEINSYQLQLTSIQEGQTAYPVTASTSGIVHMDMEYKEGMVVQAAAALGSIVNENDSYIAQVYTTANDRPLIHVGDRTEIAVSGLTQSIYGTIGGTVSYIASEATVNNENNTSAFLVKIDLDSVYLISNQGNRVNISNGMAVEARIKYDEVTYFNYVLEALGILTR